MIELFVKGQSLTLATPVVAADSRRYLTARVRFTDGRWDGLSKWLHFKCGETVYDLLLDECGRITEDDRLNLTAGEWTVYLTGVGENTRATTVPVLLTVKESGLVDAPLHEIPMSVAEQLAYLVDLALREIRALQTNTGLLIRGFKPDEETLALEVPDPQPGEAYAVGEAAPYDVFLWDSTEQRWVNAGPLVQTAAQGRQGVTFTPAVDAEGNLSWVNDGERENPEPVNLMGPTGERGEQGPAGKSAYESAAEAGYEGDEEAFLAALARLPEHAARHLPDGPDPITVRTGNLADGAVTAKKLAAGAVSQVYHAELSAQGWQGSAAPYTQTVSISGLLAADTPVVDLEMSGTLSADKRRAEDYSGLYRAVTAKNALTVYAFRKPTAALPLRLLCVRR